MAKLMDDDEVRYALASLPGWEGDAQRLERTVPVPPDQQDELVAALTRVADKVNHHPDIERTPEGLRLRLWTHTAGGVTAKDIDLAARIDQVLSGSDRRTD